MKKTKKRKFIDNYMESWKYLKSIKNYLLVSVLIFVFSIFMGFVYHTPQIDSLIKQVISDIIAKTQGKNFVEMFIFIFTNNLTTAFFSIILGILFGIAPLISNILNGYLLGYVMEKSIIAGGIGVVWRLFPHGIFELPAFFIAISLGMKMGMFVFQKDKKKYISENFMNAIKVFVFVIVPLLLIAAIIETLLIIFIK